MKCPNCGAEVTGNFCEYCGSEMKRENTTVTVTNNYYGDSSDVESSSDVKTGTCPNCNSSRISFKREEAGTYTEQVGGNDRRITSTFRTVGLCQNCGYTWQPDELRARTMEVVTGDTGKWHAPMWLWVIGWIFMFPAPLTALMLRRKEMNPYIKYGIIIFAWLIYFGAVGS